MESVIKWQTDYPEEHGTYLVTWRCNEIRAVSVAYFDGELWDNFDYGDCYVIAWCPLSEIEPYKE